MKIRPGPVLAVILLIALGSWSYFREYRGAADRRRTEEFRDRALPFERPDIQAIVIKNEHGHIRLERRGDDFRLVEPIETEVDEGGLEGLLSSLERVRIERTIGEETDLGRYGLDSPRATVTLETTDPGGALTLSLGRDNPIGGTHYALLPGDTGVALVSLSVADIAERTLLNLRDKTLLSFDPWKVTRLRIEREGEIVLLEKPRSGWQLETPIKAPADGRTVTDLLSEIERLNATGFAAESADTEALRGFGLEPPAARLTVFQEGWEEGKWVALGKGTESSRYVITGDRDAVMTVPGGFWEKVMTRVGDLRRREILGISRFSIDSIRAALNGGKAIVLDRQDDGTWSVSGLVSGSVKDEPVDLFLRMLGTLEASAFEDDPTDDLRASLAGRAVLELVLQERSASEGGQGASQHLAIGPPDRSGRVRVRDMAWGPLAVVGAGPVQGLIEQLEAIAEDAVSPPTSPTEPGAEGGDPPSARVEN